MVCVFGASRVLDGEVTVRDHGLLESATARPRASSFGTDAYETVEEKAAALLHSLVRGLLDLVRQSIGRLRSALERAGKRKAGSSMRRRRCRRRFVLPRRRWTRPGALDRTRQTVEAAPVTMSGWHHHGDNVTMGYVLKGSTTLEFGPGGSQKVEVAEGEYFEVPKNAVHREGNTSPESGEVVISRVGEGQLVFPVDGPEAT